MHTIRCRFGDWVTWEPEQGRKEAVRGSQGDFLQATQFLDYD